MSLPKKIIVWAGLFLSTFLAQASTAQMVVVANKSFGVSEIDLIVLRSILLGKSHVTPGGKRIMLVLPSAGDDLKRICESLGVNQWQITSAWSRQVYSEGNRMIYESDPAGVAKYLRENGGGIAILESPDPSILADKNLLVVKVGE